MIKKKIEKLLENELFKSISIIAKHPKMKKENRIIFEKLNNVFNDFDADDYVFARQNNQDKDFLIKAFTCACGNFKHAQSDFCSRKCHFFKQSIVEKMKQTNLEKYGVENCSQLDEVKKVISEKKLNLSQEEKQAVLEKRKKTNLEKYGVEYITQSEQVKEKSKRTCLEKYGVTSFSKTEKFVNKMKQTSLEKFGAESYSQTDEYKQRYKQTCLEKYGVDNPAKTEEFKEQQKDWFNKLTKEQKEEIKKKKENTNIIKYGFSNPNLNEEIKQKIKNTRIKKGNQHPDNIVSIFLNQWDKNRKPTASDLQKYTNIKTISNVYPLIDKENKRENFEIAYSSLEQIVEDFLLENKIKYQKHNRKIIYPKELDFYLPDYKVALEINDIETHNSTYNHYGKEPISPNYHFHKTKLCNENGIRLIHIWEHILKNQQKWEILKDIILHACGKSKKIYARNTDIIIKNAIEMKSFFEKNNLQGYRAAKTAFVLIDKITKEPLMSYTVGEAFFGKGKYDAEIVRGACKLGYSVVGGASKLWKHIIEYYKDKNLLGEKGSVNSIVYYVNLNYYNGQSMTFLNNIKFIKNQPGFWNYWVDTKQVKNREPEKHKEIKELEKQKKVWVLWNSGTQVNVWEREK